MKKQLLMMLTLMLFVCGNALAQRTVTGTVIDPDLNFPLPGVTVQVKGTQTGTISDSEGKYSIEVPEGKNTLVFRYVGYETKEEAIGSRTVIDVQLKEKVTELTDVIVDGYVQKDRPKITGSFAEVTSKTIEQVPIASFDQILQGQAPGLLATATSGRPGAPARVRIRGSSSINSSNEPLYIMDGVQILAQDFAALNPNDIESVQVLKDASATALYGSRASNGVIVIRTKRGQAGTTRFGYRMQQGWQTKTQDRFDMMDAREKLQFEMDLGDRTGAAAEPGVVDSLAALNTNWRDEFFRTARMQSHEVFASGGDEKNRFYISGQYFQQEGIQLGSQLDRFTGRINFSHDNGKKLRLGINATGGFTEDQFLVVERGANLNNPVTQAYIANPYEPVRNPETGEFNQNLTTGPNLIRELDMNDDTQKLFKVVGNVFLEYDILDNLTFRTSWGIDYRRASTARYFSPEGYLGGLNNPAGSLAKSFSDHFQYVGTNTLTYRKNIGTDHQITAIAGQEVIHRTFNNLSASSVGIVNPDLRPLFSNTQVPTDARDQVSVGSGFNENRLVSYFTNVNYLFQAKYAIDAAVRVDGSSRFGSENRFGAFYSIGGAWNIDQEDFIKGISFIQDLKLRLSYGTQGNQEIGNYAWQPFYGAFAYAGDPAFGQIQPGNPNYRWETNQVLNFGIDYALLDGRVSGTIDVYNSRTIDLFIATQLSSTTGFANLDQNVGVMRNRGIELALNAEIVRPTEVGGFSWNISGNFTYNQNRILDLFQEEEFILGTSIVKEGFPLGTQFSVRYAGVDPATGRGMYYDENGNVSMTFNDRYQVALPNTTWDAPMFGGITTSASYKGFTLSVFGSYIMNSFTLNNNRFFMENPVSFANFNQSRRLFDAWQQPGDVTDVPRWRSAENFFSTRFIEDASFFRLRNVVLSYNLPREWLESTKVIQQAQLSLQAQNLFTLTRYTSFDPEAASNLQVFDYPVPRVYTLGVDITF
ncbi:MAG: TonB-dependent receptor [Bernardetiaceae bacterium]|nr:TonB-dependent receptor [Bernardetiaceae bacterium]